MTLDPVSTGGPHVSAHNQEREAINQLGVDLEAKMDYPPLAKTGQTLRFDGVAWVPSTVQWFEGTGSPEGKIAAPVGSRYFDTTAARGGSEWVKQTGADGNTGWLVINGDTGWRDISGQILKRNAAVVHTAVMRRWGNLVDVYMDLTVPNGGDDNWLVYKFPEGFHPKMYRGGILQDNKEGASNGTVIASNGDFSILTIKRGMRDRYNGSFLVPNAWPTVNPGTELA